MAEQQAWERIVERNRVAEALPRRAYQPTEERVTMYSDAGLVDQLAADLGKLTSALEAERQKRIAAETELAWLSREVAALVKRDARTQEAIKSLALDVAALNGADRIVRVPGNGIDRPDEFWPAEYVDAVETETEQE